MRRYPLNTPRASILRRLPPIPRDATEFIGKDGFRYSGYWRTEDHVCRSLYWFGDLTPWVNEALRRLARPGTAAVDIGANIGATAVVLARSVGPDGKLTCFEPVPSNARLLRQNLDVNGFDWVTIEQVAVSDITSTVAMVIPEEQAGMSRISNERGSITVRAMRFDDWADPRQTFSVCKIDVEGHEDQVLAGMQRSINRIDSFVFERHETERVDPLLNRFIEHRFEIFRIEKSPTKTYFVPLKDPRRAYRTPDLVAVKPSFSYLLF